MALNKVLVLVVLKLVMVLIVAGWITLWVLKPTNFWTRKWKEAEESMRNTVFGYYGLNFAAYTLPVILVTIVGLVLVNFLPGLRRQSRRRVRILSMNVLPNPVAVNSIVGILSITEVTAVALFLLFLTWTFYTRISNDFMNLLPVKSLTLNLWQLKYLRVATRFGLLAEACLALLLLPVLRGLALFRLIGIQFEASVRYHMWIATSMILFATIHGGSTLLIWGVSHHIQDEIWRWQKTGRIYLAGEMTLVIGLIIWITSLPQIRTRRFELFYYAHHLYILFLIFFLFHAGDRHYYMILAGVFLFGLDKILRVIQSRPMTCVLSAHVFPCKAIELVLPKDPRLKYTPTSVVYVKVPRLSKSQWHPFSITSSFESDEDTMSVVVKCDGDWTSSLYDMIEAELHANARRTSCIPVAIEGPYGPVTLDFLRYDSLLLIAGGIGITPFLSIVKEIASTPDQNRNRLPTTIQLIYVMKKSQDISLLNSVHLLLDKSSRHCNLKLKAYVTQERCSTNTTLSELLDGHAPLTQTIYFDTNCSDHAVHGLESPLSMAMMVVLCTILFITFVVCFNHIFVPSGKKGSAKMSVESGKDGSKQKLSTTTETSSSIVDLLLLASLMVSITCSAFVAIILRWKRLNRGIPSISNKQEKVIEPSLVETRSPVEEHEIHFGARPNFQDVFSEFSRETEGCNVGVVVCGPESMKQAVASLCQVKPQGLKMDAKGKEPYFYFHSLNFTL